MKKSVIILGLVAVMCGQAMAQDTLTMNTFSSNDLYQFWPEDDTIRLTEIAYNRLYADIAPIRLETKDTLQVYGIAAIIHLGMDQSDWAQYIDTTLDSLYFNYKLFAAEPDSLRTLGKVKVHVRDTPIAYYMQLNKYDAGISLGPVEPIQPLPVYESYFDAPITVTDSFYIGYNHEAHYRVQNGYSTLYYITTRTMHRIYGSWPEDYYIAFHYGPDHGNMWRYTHMTNCYDEFFLAFPILTPDTVNHLQNITVDTVNLVDRLVAVQPNPATERVKVVASCGMERVMAYNTAGVKVHEQAATGLSTTLNVAGWPAGTYILHIQTPLGVSTKRLVVAR